MTTVTYKGKDKVFELTAEGHADYAKNGEPDIVCASISILAYQLAQVAQDMFNQRKLATKPKICLNDGYVRIKIIPFKEHRLEAMYTFRNAFLAYSILAKSYPENVQMKCPAKIERK